MKKLLYISLILALTVSSCRKGRWEGYSKTTSGLEYKIHSLGESGKYAKSGRVVIPRFSVYTLSDSLIYTNIGFEDDHVMEYQPLRDGAWMEAYSLVSEGDSATFIVQTKIIQNLIPHTNEKEVKLNLVVKRIEDRERYFFERRYPELMVDYEMEEQVKLQEFLKDIEPEEVLSVDGMYYIQESSGKGKRPETEDEVVVHYEGFFIDGKKFDSTIDRDDPFSYKIGDQGQVLDGFNIGVRQMKVGGKATFILPSQTAFKDYGSSTGIIPPYTTVMYRVELIKISKE